MQRAYEQRQRERVAELERKAALWDEAASLYAEAVAEGLSLTIGFYDLNKGDLVAQLRDELQRERLYEQEWASNS